MNLNRDSNSDLQISSLALCYWAILVLIPIHPQTLLLKCLPLLQDCMVPGTTCHLLIIILLFVLLALFHKNYFYFLNYHSYEFILHFIQFFKFIIATFIYKFMWLSPQESFPYTKHWSTTYIPYPSLSLWNPSSPNIYIETTTTPNIPIQ